MRLQKPKRLEPGARIGLIAPSSPPKPEAIDESIEAVRKMGFVPVLGAAARDRRGYLAGSDSDRARDVVRFLRDPRIDAVFALRGGYGTARLLPLIDWREFRDRPKIFAGFSDITSLHSALLSQAGWMTFHAPMVSSHLRHRETPEYTRSHLLKVLGQAAPGGSILSGHSKKGIRTIRKGSAAGRLVGGNLSVFCTLVGTPWWVPLRGKLLFLEEVDEAPYRIDRMLTFLMNSGALDGVAGIAVGVCARCEDPKKEGPGWQEVVEERLSRLKVPAALGFPFGHVPHNATLPVGARGLLDAGHGDFQILESAVK